MPRLRPLLQLVRLPAVFTAMADICLGFLSNHEKLSENPRGFAVLLASSSCLYLSGMAFNDIFDRHVDARERPKRPIPSGRVPLRLAAFVATTLMAAGVSAAALVSLQSIFVAIGLVAAILAYDGLLKNTPAGPVLMGTCRALNVLLGASAFDDPARVWTLPQVYVAAGLGIYVAGLTWFARYETQSASGESNRRRMRAAIGVANLGIASLIACVGLVLWRGSLRYLSAIAGPNAGAPELAITLVALSGIAATINHRLFAAYRQPDTARVHAAVRWMILSLVLLDAAMIYARTANAAYALATAALLVPSLLLGRRIMMT